jgi:hypothetical protein
MRRATEGIRISQADVERGAGALVPLPPLRPLLPRWLRRLLRRAR